jgi:hypothetical protein
VLNPSTDEYLRGDKGRTLAAMVGTEGARLYWHSRQALPWTSASFLVGTVFGMTTLFWHGLTAFWIVVIWYGCTLLPLLVYGFGTVCVLTWRASRLYGVPFHRSLNMPFQEPERLPDWAIAHHAKRVPPLTAGLGER